MPFSGGDVFCSLAFRALSSGLAVFIACSFFALCRKISRAERNCKPPLFELFLIFSYFVLCVCVDWLSLPLPALRDSGAAPG